MYDPDIKGHLQDGGNEWHCPECGVDVLFQQHTSECAWGGNKTMSEHDRKITINIPKPEVETKASNPKDLVGSNKLPLHLWPETATAMGCLALLDGNLKYGRTNWRAAGVKASVYVDALRRHLNAWFDSGEDVDPDSGLDPWSHILACAAIIVDARAAGKFTDDRLIKGGYRQLVDDITPHVARLKEKHAGKNPRHYTIADSEEFSK